MNKIGIFLVCVGIGLILISIGLFTYFTFQDKFAGIKSKQILDEIKVDLDATASSDISSSDINNIVSKYYNGYETVGIIKIPTIGLELPILSIWDYNKLKVAPSIYYGQIGKKGLVICGHNYASHFKYLPNLNIDDHIIITDLNNNNYYYKVKETKILNPTSIKEVMDTDYDLILFTCIKDGYVRYSVYCEKIYI